MKLLENLQYRIVYALLWCLSLIPLRGLYFISDLISWILHDVVRYRRRVVHENLVSSFPEKTAHEIAAIERRYYSFLTDYAFETVKMLHMSRETIMRRLRVENVELVDRAVARGQSVTLLLGHYCNWEWVSSLPLRFAPGCESAQVYHRLHNRAMDRVFMKIRTRFGAHNIEMADIMRRLIEWKRVERTDRHRIHSRPVPRSGAAPLHRLPQPRHRSLHRAGAHSQVSRLRGALLPHVAPEARRIRTALHAVDRHAEERADIRTDTPLLRHA